MVQRKDKETNKWLFDISNGFNPVTHERNRIIRRGFRTKQEALKAEEIYIATHCNKAISSKNITFDMLYSMMKQTDITEERKESYIKTQEYSYNKHFKKYFEKAIISKLTQSDMLAFRDELLKKDLSNNTVNKQMVLLKKLMNIAVKKQYIAENPCHNIKKLKQKTPEIDFWTVKEFKQFLSLCKDDEEAYRLIFLVAFSTGMRIGEILALTWRDIDLDDETIYVTKTLIRGTQFRSSTPKTDNSIRKVTIQNSLITTLIKWKQHQQQLLAPYFKDTEDLQIFQYVPSFINYDNVRRKYNDICKRDSTLKRIRIHDIRHSHVAFLIHNEEKEIVIKERLGHSTIKITYDIYGHLYPSKQKEVSSKLNNLF